MKHITKIILFSLILLTSCHRDKIDPETFHFKEGTPVVDLIRVKDAFATISIGASISNESDKDRIVVVRADITDDYYVEKTVAVSAKSEKCVELTTDIYEPKIWTEDNPSSYDIEISLYKEKKKIISVKDSFNIVPPIIPDSI